MLTMVHSNAARVENGIFYIDRKFLTGMQWYASALDIPLTTMHPELQPNENIMDMVGVSCAELSFKVVIVNL